MTNNQDPDGNGARGQAQDFATGDSDASWSAFIQARRALAEVMTDDELRELGIDVEVLDSRP